MADGSKQEIIESSGEVMLTVCFADHYLEFTLEPDGSVTFYHERNKKQMAYEEKLTFDEAKVKLMVFKGEYDLATN